MDLSVFYKKDWRTQQKIRSVQALLYNKNPNVISIVAFTGAGDYRQAEPFSAAIASITEFYRSKEIKINYQELTNTLVK